MLAHLSAFANEIAGRTDAQEMLPPITQPTMAGRKPFLTAETNTDRSSFYPIGERAWIALTKNK